jgi:pimeloyl-ACP methyl ester carboxylesterase
VPTGEGMGSRPPSGPFASSRNRWRSMSMKSKGCQVELTAACQTKFTAVLIACLSLSGCFGGGAARDGPGDGSVASARIEYGILAAKAGSPLRYALYHIPHARRGDLVVLGHGFLRGKERMANLARALAANGVAVATLDFRGARPWNADPIRNGLDMIRVANALGAHRVVYAGFSAGALAALIAGRNDPRARGVVALDLVDARGLGERMSAGLDRPLIALVGEPSACNAHNNGLAVFAASRHATVEHFAGADHCDFESPTDWLCRLLCQQAPGASRRADIVRETVTAVRVLLPPSPDSPDPGGW